MNYDMSFSKEVVLRINMAWVDSIPKLIETLDKHELDFFIDFPSGRIKPPNNKYSMDELTPILKSYPKIKYLAISNVESSTEIENYIAIVGKNPSIVPKIETIRGIKNISEICTKLSKGAYIMLDHDDLFTDVVKKGLGTDVFLELVEKLVSFCESEGFKLLRTRGVIFSEEI